MPVFSDLVIVVVNYNLKKDTIECLESLIKAGASLEKILLVDNASTDGSVEALISRFGAELVIIRADDNRGYPHALNLGIPQAMTMGANWILLMNNDTIVAPDFLAELENSILANSSYSLIGPLILYFSHPEIIWYLGYRILPGTLIGIRSYRGRRVTNRLPQLVPIDLMHGCAMMVKRDVFEKIGLFDDTQLIYGDDADFSWRARMAGFKCAAATRAKIWHKVSLTMGRQKPLTRYLRIRNTIGFYRKFAHGITLLIMQTFTLIRCFFLMIGDINRGQFDLIKPLWLGWLDGWLGRFPKRFQDL
jgi:GT2 family glycosyltransferase